MMLLCLHSDKPVDIRAAQEIEECAFDAVCQIVTKNQLIDMVFFCLFTKFSVSSVSKLCFTSFFFAFSGDNDELCSLKKCCDECLIGFVPSSCSMIAMYKKQVL